MRSLIYLATALCVMGLAFWAYRVNYETQDKQSELRALQREIASLHEGLGVLNAEWAYLNRPDRLRELVNMNFGRLALLPLTTALGFVGLAMVGSLAALVAFETAFRAVQRALMRPARETLFTVLPREDKYKAKAFIDTFVYRGGDVVGAQLEGLLGRLGMGLAALASVAVPLALLWAGLALWLGRTQQRMAAQLPMSKEHPPHKGENRHDFPT